MLVKPKFKMSIEEMLEFNDDCNDAASHCPQYHNDWLIEDRDICLGYIKPKSLVKHWLKCDTLFKSGYDECLSSNSLQMFDRYKEYKSLKKVFEIINKRNEAS